MHAFGMLHLVTRLEKLPCIYSVSLQFPGCVQESNATYSTTAVMFIFVVLLIVFGGRPLLFHGCCFFFVVSKYILSTFRDVLCFCLCCLHRLVDDNLAGIPRASPIPSQKLCNNQAVCDTKEKTANACKSSL